MGKITGFLEIDREDRRYAPVAERVQNYKEFVIPLSEKETRDQAARCMDCGIPYCHNGCPVNNQIPDWNDLVYKNDWEEASRNLHSTNNFPDFTGRIVGPSLDLIGPPIELLKVEGLVEPAEAGDDAPIRVTEAGMAELRRLLGANLRGPVGEFNKLVIALKMRFLHLLDRDGQLAQTELLIEVCERELARLTDLRGHHAGETGHLVDWLDHDIAQVEARLAWFRNLQSEI